MHSVMQGVDEQGRKVERALGISVKAEAQLSAQERNKRESADQTVPPKIEPAKSPRRAPGPYFDGFWPTGEVHRKICRFLAREVWCHPRGSPAETGGIHGTFLHGCLTNTSARSSATKTFSHHNSTVVSPCGPSGGNCLATQASLK